MRQERKHTRRRGNGTWDRDMGQGHGTGTWDRDMRRGQGTGKGTENGTGKKQFNAHTQLELQKKDLMKKTMNIGMKMNRHTTNKPQEQNLMSGPKHAITPQTKFTNASTSYNPSPPLRTLALCTCFAFFIAACGSPEAWTDPAPAPVKTDDSTKSPQVLPKLGAKLIAHETPGHYSVDLTPTTQDNPSHLVRRLDQSGIAQTLAPHSADHNVFHDSNVREGETYTYEVISQKDGVPIPNTTVRLTIPKDMVLSGEVSLESIKAGRLFLEKATLVSHGKQLTIEAQEIVSKGSTITVFNDSERSGSDPAHFSPGMISIKASRASGQLHIDARGVDGKDGAPGEPGAPGKPGEPGVTGRIGLNPIYVEKEHFTKELIEWATKDAQYINDGPGSVRDRLNDKRWERERQNGGHFMFIPSPAPGKGQPGSDGMPGTDGTSGTAAGNSAPVTVAIEQESTLKLTIDNEPGRPGQGGTGGKGGPGGTGGAPGARGPFIDEPFPPAGPEGKAGPDGKTGPTGHPGTRSPSLIKIGDKLIINSRELQ